MSDPPQDKAHPAGMTAFALPTHGATINAVLYTAAGAGPHPTVLLLHGLPGNEQNLDLAQAARRAGFVVLTLHYRGAWGSPGAFSFTHAIEDECYARAGQGVLFAGFQRERFYRYSGERWKELSRTARTVVVFADFAESSGPDASPLAVRIPASCNCSKGRPASTP